MRIDTPEKYRALQERRRKATKKKVRNSDRRATKVIDGGKPNHKARALIGGFSTLMTKPVTITGRFGLMGEKQAKKVQED